MYSEESKLIILVVDIKWGVGFIYNFYLNLT